MTNTLCTKQQNYPRRTKLKLENERNFYYVGSITTLDVVRCRAARQDSALEHSPRPREQARSKEGRGSLSLSQGTREASIRAREGRRPAICVLHDELAEAFPGQVGEFHTRATEGCSCSGTVSAHRRLQGHRQMAGEWQRTCSRLAHASARGSGHDARADPCCAQRMGHVSRVAS